MDISHREENGDCMDADGRAEIIGVRVVNVAGTNSHVFDCMEAEDNNAERCCRGCVDAKYSLSTKIVPLRPMCF